MKQEKERGLSVLERFAFGCGDAGCNIIYTAMTGFLLLYYTDYAGVSAAAVGVIMLISRVFDGVSDLIMGNIVDRTHSRSGKARPWILRMCIPFACRCTAILSAGKLGGECEADLCLYYIQPCVYGNLYSNQCTVFCAECADDTGSL